MLTYFKALCSRPGYLVDEASTASPLTAELFATVRDNGHILDDFRCVMGGHAIFEAQFELGKLVEDPSLSRWSVHLQEWPRDVNLRAGMLTGLWSDVAGLVSSRDSAVFDAQGAQIPSNDSNSMDDCNSRKADSTRDINKSREPSNSKNIRS
jgi:hypothetical protein